MFHEERNMEAFPVKFKFFLKIPKIQIHNYITWKIYNKYSIKKAFT